MKQDESEAEASCALWGLPLPPGSIRNGTGAVELSPFPCVRLKAELEMGLCRCEKRRVTNLFCFVHQVNVCEDCMISQHHRVSLEWASD